MMSLPEISNMTTSQLLNEWWADSKASAGTVLERNVNYNPRKGGDGLELQCWMFLGRRFGPLLGGLHH